MEENEKQMSDIKPGPPHSAVRSGNDDIPPILSPNPDSTTDSIIEDLEGDIPTADQGELPVVST